MSSHHHLLSIALSVCAGLAFAGDSLLLQPAQLKALGIETAIAGEGADTRNATLPARVVVPTEQIRIVAAPVDGMVEMLSAVPGTTVRRGQPMARLASPQALELQREVLQARSQAALQQQTLRRDEQLFGEGLIPESRLQATRAAAAQAGAQASERSQGLALAGAVPGKLGGALVLSAPIDGMVLEQSVQLGQRVEASTPLYRIARLSPLWLEVQAPVGLAATLSEGMPLRVAGTAVTGSLITVGRVVEPASQTVLLRATVSHGAESLRPGQIVEVEVAAANAAGQRLPAAALARNPGQVLAFVQTAGDGQGTRFEARPVRVLSQGGDSVIVDGIRAGERVAVKGVSGLKALLSSDGRQ